MVEVKRVSCISIPEEPFPRNRTVRTKAFVGDTVDLYTSSGFVRGEIRSIGSNVELYVQGSIVRFPISSIRNFVIAGRGKLYSSF